MFSLKRSNQNVWNFFPFLLVEPPDGYWFVPIAWVCSSSYRWIYTLRYSNMAMESLLFLDDFPIKTSIFFSGFPPRDTGGYNHNYGRPTQLMGEAIVMASTLW